MSHDESARQKRLPILDVFRVAAFSHPPPQRSPLRTTSTSKYDTFSRLFLPFLTHEPCCLRPCILQGAPPPSLKTRVHASLNPVYISNSMRIRLEQIFQKRICTSALHSYVFVCSQYIYFSPAGGTPTSVNKPFLRQHNAIQGKQKKIKLIRPELCNLSIKAYVGLTPLIFPANHDTSH